MENQATKEPQIGQLPRAKPWAEKSADERTELLRKEARELRRTVNVLVDLLNRMGAHQHAHDGRILVPIESGFAPGIAGTQRFHDPLA